jgi:hypothetical protein
MGNGKSSSLVLDRANEDDGGIKLIELPLQLESLVRKNIIRNCTSTFDSRRICLKMEPYPRLEIVFEPFHYRQNIVGDGGTFRGKVELVSAEYIGIVKLACAQLGLTYYDRFTPGEAKAYVTDQKLELLGWLQEPRHPMRHRNDALRQLVKYLIVKRGIQHPLTTAWRRK